jgi:hypothetical protein
MKIVHLYGKVGQAHLRAHVCVEDGEKWSEELVRMFATEVEFILTDGLRAEDVLITDDSVETRDCPGFICSDRCCFR